MLPPTPASELLPDPQADASLGHCAWFVWDLRRSGLVPREQLDPAVVNFLRNRADAEPPELAEFLVSEGVLTSLQAERILQGKTDGFVLGPYTLTDVLGAGSMGTVYKARSKTDDKLYALKVLPRRSIWNVRLAKRWVKSFGQCRHPAVVAFVDVGTSGGLHFLAWPYVEGRALDQAMAEKGKLPPGKAALIALQAAEALHACHQLGLYHGLLKPSNLLIDPDGRLRLLDCGIGCLLGQNPDESMVDTMSTANAIVAGLDCASPERIADPKAVTPAGDQYSLGCVLYFLLTGTFPFPGKAAVEKMVGHQLKQATPVRDLVPEIPEGLAVVVARLMEKDPAKRYANCAEVVDALRPFAAVPKRMVSRPVPTLKSLPDRGAPPVPPRPKPAAAAAGAATPKSAPAVTPEVAAAVPGADAPVARPKSAPPVPAPPEPQMPQRAATAKNAMLFRLILFIALFCAAALVLHLGGTGWFAFAGDQAKRLQQAVVSALVAGAVLALLAPRRVRAQARVPESAYTE